MPVSTGSTSIMQPISEHSIPASRNTASIALTARLPSGRVAFPLVFEGPPGLVHGGFLAVFFDSVIQHQNCVAGLSGKTRSLQVTFRRPTPVLTELRFDIARSQVPRGLTSTARLLLGEEVLCFGEVATLAMPPEKLTGHRLGKRRAGRPDVATHRFRQPRVAELVASKLRDDILSGRLKEGDVLPSQEALFAEFGVSPPALREAIHLLETDGLISVRRGNVGWRVGSPSDRRADRAHDQHGVADADPRRQWMSVKR